MRLAFLKFQIREFITRTLVLLLPQVERRMRFASYLAAGTQPDPALEPELFFLPRLIPANSIFIDIGANKGEYLFAVSHSRKDVTLIGFEPIPDLVWALRRLFPAANIQQLALSDAPGQASFKIPYLNGRPMPTRGTLETSYREPGEQNMKEIQVTLATLDHWCQQQSLVPGLIKIDVEGHEWTVLKGAEAIIRQHSPLLMVEIEQRHHPNAPIWDSIHQFMQTFGYRVFFFDAPAGCMTELTGPAQIRQDLSDHKTRSYINNFFFFPAAKADVLAATALAKG